MGSQISSLRPLVSLSEQSDSFLAQRIGREWVRPLSYELLIPTLVAFQIFSLHILIYYYIITRLANTIYPHDLNI